MRTSKKVTALAASVALVCAPVQADDTEIYVGTEEVSKKPNVLFIMDTSGSMDARHEVAEVPYDVNVDYPGDCEDGRVYWSEEDSGWGWGGSEPTEPPTCGTNRWIEAAHVVCEDINTSLASDSGMAIESAAQDRGSHWNPWQSLQVGNHDDDVDCRGGWSGGGTYHFYSGNYVNWYHSVGGTTMMDRLEIVQDVAKDLVDSISGVNIGLMRFNGNHGGYVDVAVDDITENRDEFKTRIDGYDHNGNTPLSETLYEAALYWRGDEVEYGYEDGGWRNDGHYLSAEKSRDGDTYISPIEHECQKNHIVYLTDGEPTQDGDVDDEIEDWLEAAGLGDRCSGNCLDDLAGFLNSEDQIDDHILARDQNVVTHTVGFHTDQDLLRDTAQKGGGKYYTAYSYGELKSALTALFTGILSGTSLFTAPAVSVNAFNRLEHLNQVYFALFRPDEGAVWPGNVKRYKMSSDGQLVDADDVLAVGDDGQFKEEISSYWSDGDGNNVLEGGAAEQLETARHLYTYTGGDAPIDVDLTQSTHALSDNNGALSGLLDVSDGAYRDRLLRWITGEDVDDIDGDGQTDDARQRMGDPLHSQPALVTYGDSEDDPLLTMFLATNEGYVHAIDTDSGDELWAFMPQELLPNIQAQYENAVTGERTYGLDGPLSVATSGGDISLFVGMRRGGRSYFALDVTDRESPVLSWKITGGQGDFAELGQTWSQPIPTRINIDGDPKDVLIFAGGYDPDQDDYAVRTVDSQGRAIFIVDADDGSLLWSGAGDADDIAGDHDKTFPAMDYSIPSDLRVIDIDNDGLADQMYVGDMGGQLWRFDIHNGSAADDLVTGAVIADLAADEDSSRTRRFYYPPDLALINDGADQWLSMSIGSGWRAHPLDDVVNDRFYMIRNQHAYGPPTDEDGQISYRTIDNSDLYDATDNDIGQGSEQEVIAAETGLASREGWYIDLENTGEKVMAESVTLDGQIIFTTYQPEQEGTVSSCAPGEGVSRAYLVNLLDATPVDDQNEDGDETKDDRSVTLERGGIPPGATIIVTDGQTRGLVGPEQPFPDLDDGGRKRQVYWRQ